MQQYSWMWLARVFRGKLTFTRCKEDLPKRDSERHTKYPKKQYVRCLPKAGFTFEKQKISSFRVCLLWLHLQRSARHAGHRIWCTQRCSAFGRKKRINKLTMWKLDAHFSRNKLWMHNKYWHAESTEKQWKRFPECSLSTKESDIYLLFLWHAHTRSNQHLFLTLTLYIPSKMTLSLHLFFYKTLTFWNTPLPTIWTRSIL